MNDNGIKELVELSNTILREIKLSKFLNEDSINIKRLESINWKYKNKKHYVSILSLEEDKIYKFMNSIISNNIFLDSYENLKIPNIEIQNTKIKNYFSIKKMFLDGNVETVKSRMDESLEDVFNQEMITLNNKNLEKYIIEKNLSFVNNTDKYELIKNIIFSNIKLKDLSKLINEKDVSSLKMINNYGIREIINSDFIVVLLDSQKYLSNENKILIKNIFEDLDASNHSKIHFLIDKNKEDINEIKIKDELNEFIRKVIPGHKNVNCRFISLENSEIIKILKSNIDNEKYKNKFVEKYKNIIEKYNNNEQQQSIENIINNEIELLSEENGFEEFENDIASSIYNKYSKKFLDDSKKNLSIVLENISTKVTYKINSLNKNNGQLYEISEEIKNEINKINLEDSDLKYIAENEFKELEFKINHILKGLKTTIIANIRNSLIKDNHISSYDKESLSIIVKDIQENILSSTQIIVDRELEKIKILCMESQYKIYIESQYKLSIESQKKMNTIAKNKFNELIKEFTKTTAEDHEFSKKEFEVANYISNFSSIKNYIYSSYESDGTYTETQFDLSAAVIGTLSFALAGMTISGLIGILMFRLNIALVIGVGTLLSAIVGFFTTFKKEVVKEKEVKVYKVDINMLRGDTNNTIEKIVSDATKYTSINLKKFQSKHMEFLESDISTFLCCLGDDSCNIINTHKKEMNEMIDLKFNIDKHIKEFLKLKSNDNSIKQEK